MEESDKIAYTQVAEVLKNMDKFYVNKIPIRLRDFFEDNKLENYNFKLKKDVKLKDQNLDKKALSILAMLDINYLCSSEKEKEELIKKYAENDKKHEEELREKYNPDKIFKKNLDVCDSWSLAKYEPKKWYKRLFEKLIRLFIKKQM